jgi:hypothetical protein
MARAGREVEGPEVEDELRAAGRGLGRADDAIVGRPPTRSANSAKRVSAFMRDFLGSSQAHKLTSSFTRRAIR